MKRQKRKLNLDWKDKEQVRLYKAMDMRLRRGSKAGEYRSEPSRARKSRMWTEILGVNVRLGARP